MIGLKPSRASGFCSLINSTYNVFFPHCNIFWLYHFCCVKIAAIKPWWVWAYWVSPLMYGQRAISVNEFSSSRWSKVCLLAFVFFFILLLLFGLFIFLSYLLLLNVSFQGTVSGNNTVGTNVLLSHNLPTQDYWYWIGVGVLLAYAILFNALFTLALAFLNRKYWNKTTNF